MKGSLVSEKGYLKKVAVKLGEYAFEESDPYGENTK